VSRAHKIEAVIPVTAAHERQTVLSKTKPAIDRPHTMFVQRPRVVAVMWKVIVAFLVGPDCPPLEVGNGLVKDRTIMSHTDVTAHGIG
jgi:hypothetical protein